jgi:dCMP deaminase
MELYEQQVRTPSWEELIKVAFTIALMSPDPSTQNAAFLVHPDKGRTLVQQSIAVNDFPRDVKVTPERWERPDKYFYVEHAERNAIYGAGRDGVEIQGLAMVTLWASCADCARAIIQSGITTVVRYAMPINPSWKMSCDAGERMFSESGIEIVTIDTPMPNIKSIRRDGTMWSPSNT